MPSSRHGYQGIEWTWFIETATGPISDPVENPAELITRFASGAYPHDGGHFYVVRCSHGGNMNSGRYTRAYEHGKNWHGPVDQPRIVFRVTNKRTVKWNYHRPYGTKPKSATKTYDAAAFAEFIKRRKKVMFLIKDK